MHSHLWVWANHHAPCFVSATHTAAGPRAPCRPWTAVAEAVDVDVGGFAGDNGANHGDACMHACIHSFTHSRLRSPVHASHPSVHPFHHSIHATRPGPKEHRGALWDSRSEVMQVVRLVKLTWVDIDSTPSIDTGHGPLSTDARRETIVYLAAQFLVVLVLLNTQPPSLSLFPPPYRSSCLASVTPYRHSLGLINTHPHYTPLALLPCSRLACPLYQPASSTAQPRNHSSRSARAFLAPNTSPRLPHWLPLFCLGPRSTTRSADHPSCRSSTCPPSRRRLQPTSTTNCRPSPTTDRGPRPARPWRPTRSSRMAAMPRFSCPRWRR